MDASSAPPSRGSRIPASWSLDFALALTFTGLVVPTLRDRPHVAAALTAGLVAVLAASWPYKLGLIAAAIAGILVGTALESLGRPTSALHNPGKEDRR